MKARNKANSFCSNKDDVFLIESNNNIEINNIDNKDINKKDDLNNGFFLLFFVNKKKIF